MEYEKLIWKSQLTWPDRENFAIRRWAKDNEISICTMYQFCALYALYLCVNGKTLIVNGLI